MAEESRKRQRLDSLIESAKDIYNENETREKENLQLREEVTRLKLDLGELEMVKKDLTEVKKQLRQKSQKCVKLELDIARVTKHNEEETARSNANFIEHEKVKKNLAQIREELNQKSQECERREVDVARIAERNQEKRAVIKSYSGVRAETDRLESVHNQLRISIMQLRTDNSIIKTDRKKLDAKNARLEAKVAKLEQEAEDRIEDLGSKIEEIRILKEQLDELGHKTSTSGEDEVDTVRNNPRHEDQSDPLEITTAHSESLIVEATSSSGSGSTNSSPLLAVNIYNDWDARIAAMSREELVGLYEQIFEILCTNNANPQASLQSAISSALSGNMIPYIDCNRRETWPGTLRLWNSRLSTATELDLKGLLSNLLPQVFIRNFTANRVRIQVGTGLLPEVDSEDERIQTRRALPSAIDSEDRNPTWPWTMEASNFGSEESSSGARRSIRLRDVERN
ncbi:hypothetical protein Vi05172_g8818 [Venturia inaequalis]|uniref:Uncharacterized protein n=1 Tax=Venturia inaequalis TaxID=5025 RepID=A0A8H3ZAR0_VENIN|nr:hypothetical protein EG327_002740 [Venturia inaequalis]RDI81217.1 hypothetical protein Vi05172_g8818 [Venturia inaequalis]